MGKKILLSENISEKGTSILKEAGYEVIVSSGTDEASMIAAIQDVDGLIVRSSLLTAPMIEAAKNLKIISRHGTGIDNVDVECATKNNIVVAKVDGANAYSVAEYVIACILTLGRRLNKSDALFKNKEICIEGASLPGLAVKLDLNGSEIKGKTLGIIGLGKIGVILANLANALGMNVIAYDPYVTDVPQQVKMVSTLEELYKECEYISVNVPLTPQTKNIINKETIASMKDGVIIINAGRGGVVNENDLYDALVSGKVAGAALDVFEQEPPLSTNPILEAPNVLLTSHIAGTTTEAGDALAQGAATAIVDFFSGKKPQFTVNYDEVNQ